MKNSLCVSLVGLYPFGHDLLGKPVSTFPDHAPGLAGEFRGLSLEMAGNPLVEPALELGGQIEDFDGHGLGPSSSQKLAVRTAGGPR
jgi:hypothetical protein